jgi:hypothetical protein
MWVTGYDGERKFERDTHDEVPDVRSDTCSQARTRCQELSPATGVPRARMAAGKTPCNSNEVSQRSPQLVIQSADNWDAYWLRANQAPASWQNELVGETWNRCSRRIRLQQVIDDNMNHAENKTVTLQDSRAGKGRNECGRKATACPAPRHGCCAHAS